MEEWLNRSAIAQGEAIGRGEVDPVALVEGYLERIAAHPHGARIYARTTPERARAEARAAAKRAREGCRLSPLDGVAISWKDLFDTAQIPTEAGSRLLAGRVPEADAPVLARASALGLVCLGKTHMSELAFSGLGYNPSTQTPPCITNETLAPGGSSSGAAASVAFGLAAAAIGSDTGGSVRLPAAWNNLVGLKTTAGRVTLEGTVPLAPSFDTIGPLTRSVADAAQLLAAMEGREAPDMRGVALKGLRFARLVSYAEDDLHEAQRRAYEAALGQLAAHGAEIVPLETPLVERVCALSGVLYTSEAYGTWAEAIEAAPEKMFSLVRERFQAGASHRACDYVAAWQKLEQQRATWGETVASYDAVLCPTSAGMPPEIERLERDEAYYVEENLRALRNTRIGNLLGLCAITLPTGTDSCGISLMAPPMQENHLLRIASAAEAAIALA